MKNYPILGKYECTTLLGEEKTEIGCFLWIKNKEELYSLDNESSGLKIIVERISKLECVELYEGYKDLWFPKKKIIMHYRPLEGTQPKDLIDLIKMNSIKPNKNLAGHIFKRK